VCRLGQGQFTCCGKEEGRIDREIFLDGDDANMTRVGGMTAAPQHEAEWFVLSFSRASVLVDPKLVGV
jgi:hypothetical protein